jgi:hypothetical protein
LSSSSSSAADDANCRFGVLLLMFALRHRPQCLSAASQTDHTEKELQLVVLVVAAAHCHTTPTKLVCLICNLKKQK